MKKTKDYRKGFFTHVHHGGRVIEWSDDIEERFEYIRRKPENERELRVALIIRVPDELIPARLRKARADYNKARADYYKAGAAYDKAGAAYDKAGADYNKASAAFDKASAAFDKARADYNKAGAAYDKAGAAYDKAKADYDWESIYAQIKLANSPWDGKTIFSRGTGIKAIL